MSYYTLHYVTICFFTELLLLPLLSFPVDTKDDSTHTRRLNPVDLSLYAVTDSSLNEKLGHTMEDVRNIASDILQKDHQLVLPEHQVFNEQLSVLQNDKSYYSRVS